MTEAVTVALITGGLAVICNLIVALTSNSKTIYRIDQLERKMEKHNKVLERLALLERDKETQWKRIDEIKEDLTDLREKK